MGERIDRAVAQARRAPQVRQEARYVGGCEGRPCRALAGSPRLEGGGEFEPARGVAQPASQAGVAGAQEACELPSGFPLRLKQLCCCVAHRSS